MAHKTARSSSAAISWWLSISLAFLGMPPAMSQGTSYGGSGGSITIDTVDPATGQHVDAGLIRQGQQVRVVVKAFDSSGREIACGRPQIGVINGVSGNQLIAPAPGAPDIITGGPGFGSAEITVKCPNLPDVQFKSFAASSGRPLAGARPQAPTPAPAAPAAAEPPASGSGMGTMLVVGGLVLGAAALAAAAGGGGGSSGTSCSAGSHACQPPNSNICCPNGTTLYCTNNNTCTNLNSGTFGNLCGGNQSAAASCGQ